MEVASYRFRAFAVLLSYPAADWLAELDAIVEPLRQANDPAVTAELVALEEFLKGRSVEEVQEYYVNLFDRTRAVSLHLLEHSHGDARERGAAMARLSDLYRTEGWSLALPELPDYLPAFCEFLSLIDEARCSELLAEARPVIAEVGERLRQKSSPYAVVLDLLAGATTPAEVLTTAAQPPMQAGMSALELRALDAEWEEQPVSFAVGAAHDSVAGFVPLDRIARRTSSASSHSLAKDQVT